jgi:hypothetical protein
VCDVRLNPFAQKMCEFYAFGSSQFFDAHIRYLAFFGERVVACFVLLVSAEMRGYHKPFFFFKVGRRVIKAFFQSLFYYELIIFFVVVF